MERVAAKSGPRIPKELVERMRKKLREERARQVRASQWQGEYGYGAGRAHPSVEFATCPHCGSAPGRLCIGAMGPMLGHHFSRSKVYREMKRKAVEQLQRETRVGEDEK